MSYSVMIDGMHASAGNIPVSTPKVAGYVTGTPDIEWVPSDWARFPSSGHVRIDQSPALAAWASGAADVADMENGAATQASFNCLGGAAAAGGQFAYMVQKD